MLLTSCQVSFLISAFSRADRACPERAGRGQSANSRLRDALGARKIGLRGALREALHGLMALMGCERRRATEARAFARTRPAPVLARIKASFQAEAYFRISLCVVQKMRLELR